MQIPFNLNNVLEQADKMLDNEKCLRCDVCCRFGDFSSPFSPCLLSGEKERLLKSPVLNDGGFVGVGEKDARFLRLKSYKDHYCCPCFSSDSNSCRIYSERPLDCRLYPFMLMFGEGYSSVELVLDMQCPQASEVLSSPKMSALKESAEKAFSEETFLELIKENHSFIMDFDDCAENILTLEKLTQEFFFGEGFRRISLYHKGEFDEIFSKLPHRSSSRSFQSVYLWKDLFNIQFKNIAGQLCVFYELSGEVNMLLPPVGGQMSSGILSECGRILSDKGSGIFRVENVLEQELYVFSDNIEKSVSHDEYIYETALLSSLEGRALRSKRKLAQKISCNSDLRFREMNYSDAESCMDLYTKWFERKSARAEKDTPAFLLEEGFVSHRRAFLDKDSLGIKAYVVEGDSGIIGYTFGFMIGDEMFCVFAEVCDNEYRGLPQFIFQQLAVAHKDVKYINAMGDLGEESLRQAKTLYRPIELLKHYILKIRSDVL